MDNILQAVVGTYQMMGINIRLKDLYEQGLYVVECDGRFITIPYECLPGSGDELEMTDDGIIDYVLRFVTA